MSPDPRARDLEEEECLNGVKFDDAPVHQGRRIQSDDPPPVRAWTVNEEQERPGEDPDSGTSSPGEDRRLLSPARARPPPAKPVAGPRAARTGCKENDRKKPSRRRLPGPAKKQKSKFQKRKEKLIAALKPPYFILAMILVISCVHAWGTDAARALLEWAPGAWWREPWRLLTYGCVHATDAHLALNAVVALAVGWRLELEQGWRRVAAVWCGGVAAGALGAGALQPRVRVVGASAAVYALLTAHLPNVCLRFGHIPLWWFRLLSVVVLGASEASWAMLRAPPAPAPAAAWAAHLLGAVAGISLGFLVFSGENYKNRYVVAGRAASAAGLVLAALAAAAHHVLRPAGERRA